VLITRTTAVLIAAVRLCVAGKLLLFHSLRLRRCFGTFSPNRVTDCIDQRESRKANKQIGVRDVKYVGH